MSDTKDALVRNVSRRGFLTAGAMAGAGVVGSGALLAGCGGGSDTPAPQTSGSGGTGQVGGQLTWGNWANPGEQARFKEYSTDYQKRSGTKITYQTVTGDYASKLLTQLAGGQAPDAFYVNDALIAKAIAGGVLEELGQYPEAKKLADQTYPGLAQWVKSPDGSGTYGVDVDCNPLVFWFNKKILAEAGVTQDPAAAFEAGTWNQATVTDMLTKIKATGKRGAVLRNDYGDLFSWITTFGGTAFDDSGKAVFDTDPKAQTAIAWLFEQINNGNITYGGSLPKGQSADPLFYAGQLASMQLGRWVLPNLKKLKGTIDYDIAPFPSEAGNEVMPVIVYTACMSINAKSTNKEAALAFLADFCSTEGQRFRLSGGGNAVPSIPGAEDIATEGNDPAHGAWFNDIASKGYAIPLAMIKKGDTFTNFTLKMDTLIKDKSTTPKSFSEALVQILNAD